MKRTLTALFTFALAQVLQLALLSAPAFAVQADRMTIAMMRQDNANNGTIRIVKVEGALSCEAPLIDNNGRGCVLNLRDSKTGRSFRLIEDNAAQHLYNTGKKNVSIEGTLADSETIRVNKASSL